MKRWIVALAASALSALTLAEDGLLFTAEDTAHGREPWLLFQDEFTFLGDLRPGVHFPESRPATLFSSLGDTVFFMADDACHGWELWEWKGGQPTLTTELVPGFQEMRPGPGVAFGDELILPVRTGMSYRSSFKQLWSIREGERRCIYHCDKIHGPFPAGDRLLFLDYRRASMPRSTRGTNEWVLVSYDGSGFSQIASGHTDFIPNQHASAVMEGQFFTMLSGTQPGTSALYRIDATGAHLIEDGISAELLLAVGSSLYGLGSNTTWHYDGTEVTQLLSSRLSYHSILFTGYQDPRINAVVQGDEILAISQGRTYRINRIQGDQVEPHPTLGDIQGLGTLKSIGGTAYLYGRGPSGPGIYRLDETGTFLAPAVFPQEATTSSYDFHVKGSTVFYGNRDGDLVVDDGTGPSEYPLLDHLRFGEPPRSSYPQSGCHHEGWLYFRASTPETGWELWRTDGDTVELVADLNPGPEPSTPLHLTSFKGRLYFTAKPDGFSEACYVWDGIAVQLLTIDPTAGPLTSGIESLATAGDFLMIESDGSILDAWDGQNPPVRQEFQSLGSYAADNSFTEYQGAYYFPAADATSGRELWRFSSGTFELVVDAAPDAEDSLPGHLTVANDVLYWSAETALTGRELWKFDGASAEMIADINPGPAGSDPVPGAVRGDDFFFAATGPDGREPWRTGPGGTGMLSDLETGAGSSSPRDFVNTSAGLVFAAFTSTTGGELFISRDGQSVELLADLSPGASSSFPTLEVVDGDDLYHHVLSTENGPRLSHFDGTAVRFVTASETIRDPVLLGSALGAHWFTAKGVRGEAASALYRLTPPVGQPAAATLQFVVDLDHHHPVAPPAFRGEVGGGLLLTTRCSQHGSEPVHLAPGEGACGQRQFDLAPGTEQIYPRLGSTITMTASVPGALYFATATNQVFRYDGRRVEEVAIETHRYPFRNIEEFHRLGDTLYVIVRNDGPHSFYELLEIDGVRATIVSGCEDLMPYLLSFTVAGDRAVFAARPVVGGSGTPWVLDGGSVREIAPPSGTPALSPAGFVSHRGTVYLSVRDTASTANVYRLIRTNGARVEEFDIGDPEYAPLLFPAGSNLYIFCRLDGGARDLKVMTPSGLRTPAGQPDTIYSPEQLTPIGNNLYFLSELTYLDPAELYRATATSVSRVPQGTNALYLTSTGTGLYFRGTIPEDDGLFYTTGTYAQPITSNIFDPHPPNPFGLHWANGRLYLNGTRDFQGFPLRGAYELTGHNSFRLIHGRDVDWWLPVEGAMVCADDHLDDHATIILKNGAEYQGDVLASRYRSRWHEFDGGAVASASRPGTGDELFFFDGLELTLLKDLVPGSASSTPEQFYTIDLDPGIFQATHPFALWLADRGVAVADPSPEGLAALLDESGDPYLLRYASGFSSADARGRIGIAHVDSGVTLLTLAVAASAPPGVSLILESSTSLQEDAWSPVARRQSSGTWIKYGGVQRIDDQGDWILLTIVLPTAPLRGHYFRLRADLIP